MFDKLRKGQVIVRFGRITIDDLKLVRRYCKLHSALLVKLHRVNVGPLSQLLQALLLYHQVKLARLLRLENLLSGHLPTVKAI